MLRLPWHEQLSPGFAHDQSGSSHPKIGRPVVGLDPWAPQSWCWSWYPQEPHTQL